MLSVPSSTNIGASTRRSRLEPLFFGHEDRAFGILDLPVATVPPRAAVVVCAPLGHEATWCHRALRTLASRLVAAGHPVLRFDAFGCGDARGEDEDASLEDWIEDAAAALELARERFGSAGAPHVVGLRLGASLAYRALSRGGSAASLLLWEPVVDGAAHVRELQALDELHRRQCGAPAAPTSTSDEALEVLGFRYSPAARRSLEALALDAWVRERALPADKRVLQLAQRESEERARLLQALTEAGTARVTARVVDEPSAWLLEPYRMAMPVASLALATAWITEGDV